MIKIFLISITVFLGFIINHVYASSKIDSLTNKINEYHQTQSIKDSTLVNFYFELGDEYILNDINQTLKITNDAYELSKKIGYQFGIENSLNSLGYIYFQIGEIEKSIIQFKMLNKIVQETGTIDGKADLLNNIGYIYAHQSMPDSALIYYKQSLILMIQNKDSSRISTNYNNVGSVFNALGQIDSAIYYFNKAIEVSTMLGNLDDRAHGLNSLSLLYDSKNNFNTKCELLNDALEIFTKGNNTLGQASTYYNLSITYHENQKNEEAIKFATKALELAKKINNIETEGASILLLGSIYTTIGKKDLAIDCYEKSLKINELIGNKYMIISNLNELSAFYAEKGNYQKAYNYANRALILGKEIQNPESMSSSYKTLSNIFKKQNKYQEAYLNYALYIELKDSINKVNNEKHLNELGVKYKTEKKEKEIEILNREKAENKLIFIESQEKNYRQKLILSIILAFITLSGIFLFIIYRNREKQKRLILQSELSFYVQKAMSLQINPHFIYNAMNSIQKSIYMDDKIISNEHVSKFASLMRIVLENSQSSLIPIKDEIEALSIYLDFESLRARDKIKYTIDIDKKIDQLTCKIPPLLIQPFVENAIWHGIMNRINPGKIDISLVLEKDSILCIIDDDGIGRTEAAKISNNIQKKSLGMNITKKRLELLHKLYGTKMKFNVIDKVDEINKPTGTKIEMSIPVVI